LRTASDVFSASALNLRYGYRLEIDKRLPGDTNSGADQREAAKLADTAIRDKGPEAKFVSRP